jgi:ABC-type multidrug transport system fused ATPase/permease subunit
MLAHSSVRFFLAGIIDSFLENTEIIFLSLKINALYFYSTIFIFVVIINVFLETFLNSLMLKKISFDIYKNYTQEVFSKIILYPVSFFKKNTIGKMAYQNTNEPESLEGSVVDIHSSFGSPVVLITNLFFVFLISQKVFLFLFSVFFLYIFIFIFTKKKVEDLQDSYNQKRKGVGNILIEKLNLVFEIKKNNKEDSE